MCTLKSCVEFNLHFTINFSSRSFLPLQVANKLVAVEIGEIKKNRESVNFSSSHELVVFSLCMLAMLKMKENLFRSFFSPVSSHVVSLVRCTKICVKVVEISCCYRDFLPP